MWSVPPDRFPEEPKDCLSEGSVTNKPTVLIVGAGLGGLMLGALLEKANIPYYIFERASCVKPLGSAINIAAPVLPLFEQIGIFDQIEASGKQFTHSTLYREGKGEIFTTDYTPIKQFTGYKQYIVSRPVLYDLILQKVPSHRLLFKKRVLMISEHKDKVRIQTGDNCIYEGDILVGADGAYSAVRQRLYDTLKREGRLPNSDQKDLPFSCTCLVGQTRPLDSAEFPIIQEALCQFFSTLGDNKPFSYALFTTAQRNICYAVVHQLDAKSSKAAEEQRFRNNENSEWGPGAVQAMCVETRDFPLPIPGAKKWTMGDLYDRTPHEGISKVMLEEKVFKTWYSGRIVLMGDGAAVAMHDAVALANLIYALPNNTSKEIQRAFAEYKAERIPHVMDSYKSSKILAKRSGMDFGGTMALFFSKNIPQFVWNVLWKSMVKNRPVAGFLPKIPSKGAIPAVGSASEQKARAVFERRKADVHAV
ncbi:hypothetical protein BG015_006596 [Linnemannia schmuckeri]|uniref:FAD-binding domain-containing protein n=1 Tax=Linnemannia schmuckeri TaxID=64567 RepID=A0A9P5VBQ1_9FUNG|nr:hypothetical protein BG015_006596 [Linnemannia schmuckeri]